MSLAIWITTIVILIALISIDLVIAVIRRNKETTFVEALVWTIIYVGSALLFGLLMGHWTSAQSQQEFFAGWLTEYALSVDNIFVFIIILANLRVPKEKQQLVLMLGILTTIAMRGVLIPTGAAVISRFNSVFFLFGAFLIYTAYKLAAERNEEDAWKEGKLVASMKARGMSLFAIAYIALGITNLIFSFDSIPAIFGLTTDPYVVTTANFFALMGLRQLYFLLEGLLTRLVHLAHGLAFILAFIGIKMIFEALHGIGVDEIAGVHVPIVSLQISLGFIIVTLITITVTSLHVTRKKV